MYLITKVRKIDDTMKNLRLLTLKSKSTSNGKKICPRVKDRFNNLDKFNGVMVKVSALSLQGQWF